MDKQKLWEKIKKSVMEGVTTAAEKTEEYTKIGKAKLDILAVKRKISKNFTELGGIVYDGVKDKKGEAALKSDKVKVLMEKLNKLDEDLDKKEAALEEMMKKESKKEKAEKKKPAE